MLAYHVYLMDGRGLAQTHKWLTVVVNGGEGPTVGLGFSIANTGGQIHDLPPLVSLGFSE